MLITQTRPHELSPSQLVLLILKNLFWMMLSYVGLQKLGGARFSMRFTLSISCWLSRSQVFAKIAWSTWTCISNPQGIIHYLLSNLGWSNIIKPFGMHILITSLGASAWDEITVTCEHKVEVADSNFLTTKHELTKHCSKHEFHRVYASRVFD